MQQCSKQDILNLPKFETGIDLRECNLSDEELLFLGMCAGIASTQPRFKISPYAGEQNGRKNRFKRIAKLLPEIKHWQTQFGDYKNLPDIEATWFIDPPYQFGGEHYSVNGIDYSELAEWCKTRKGQVIVCENTKATWLPFKAVTKIQGAGQTFTTEAIWSNHVTNYDNTQLTLL